MLKLTSLIEFQVISAVCLVFSIQVSASAQNPKPRHLVDDGNPPMSAVIGYAAIGTDSAIVVDNTHTHLLIYIRSPRENNWTEW